ncbi:MAG TPA: PA14 domain-containing protein, partial [Phycisphaerae bacterium]|nr:PA14 domain-containing protein [Phycisphaerae bacterium]
MSSHHSLKGLGALVVAMAMLAAAGTAHALPLYGDGINEGGTWTGSYTAVGDTYTIQASGADIWSTDDGMYFVYQEFSATDPFDFYAYVGAPTGFTGIQPPGTINAWAKAGIHVRQSLDPKSNNAMSLIAHTDTNGINAQIRPAYNVAAKGSTEGIGTRTTHDTPVWLRLTYDGANQFETYYNDVDPGGAPPNPANWTKVSNDTAMVMNAGSELHDTILVGLAVTSHDTNNLTQIQFQDVHGFLLWLWDLASIASDDWHLATTWAGTAPPPGGVPDADTVTTVDSETVTARTGQTNLTGQLDITAGGVVVETGATLTVVGNTAVSAAAALTIDGALDTGSLTTAAALTIDGTLDAGSISSDSALTVNGAVNAGSLTTSAAITANGTVDAGNISNTALTTLGSGGLLRAGGGGIQAVTTLGNATVEVNTGTLTATDLNLAAGMTFTKDGDGALRFTSGSNTIDSTNIVKVQGGGELFMQAASNPLGGGDLILDGGIFAVRGGAAPLVGAMYVKVLQNLNEPLNMAEVQVFETGTGDNVALDITGSVASQSSTGSGGLAPRAIDGNTSGVWTDGSVQHTTAGVGEWWQVQLASAADLDAVHVWGRTDVGCFHRQDDFNLIISDDADIELYNERITGVGSGPGANRRIEVASIGAIDMEDTDVSVTAASTLNAVTQYDAKFGQLSIAPGAALTTQGAPGGFMFTDGTLTSTPGVVTITGPGNAGLNTESDTTLAGINAGANVVNFTKGGAGDLVLTVPGGSTLPAGSVVDVAAGRLAATYDATGGKSPFDQADLRLGDAELAIDVDDHTSQTFDHAVEVYGNATLTGGLAAGAETLTIGSAGKGMTMTTGKLTVQPFDNHVVELAGPMTGAAPGTTAGIEGAGGTVQIAATGGGDVGYVDVTGGTMDIDAAITTIGGIGLLPGLAHLGFHANNDNLYLDLNNNGGMMTLPPDGTAVLTDGPGNRGLDFNNDGDFTATGAISVTDNYSNLFFGILRITEAGDYTLRVNQDDDRCGMWLDLDQDGVFESTTAGLGSNRGEQLQWDSDHAAKVLTLAVGDYLFATTHREGTSGSGVHVMFKTPGMAAEETLKPTDPDQQGLDGLGMWLTEQPGYNRVSVLGGTLNLNADVTTPLTSVRSGALNVNAGATLDSDQVIISSGTADVNATATLRTDELNLFGGTANLNAGATLLTNEVNVIGGTANLNAGSTVVMAGGAGGLVTQTGGIINAATPVGNTETDFDVSGTGVYNSTGAVVARRLDVGSAGTFNSNATMTAAQINVNGGTLVLNQPTTVTGGAFLLANEVDYGWYNDTSVNLLGQIDDGSVNGINGGLFAITPSPESSWPTQVQGKAVWTGEIWQAGNMSDTYNQMWSGYFIAPETGTYEFYVHGDDQEIFFIDQNQNGDFEINGTENVTTNLPPEHWNTPKTGTIDLVQDEVYAFALAHNEGTGGDWVNFTIQTPTGSAIHANPSDAAQAGWWNRGIVLESLLRVQGGSTGTVDANAAVTYGHLIVGADGVYNANVVGSVDVSAVIDILPGGTLNANIADVLNGASPTIGGTVNVNADGAVYGANLNLVTGGYIDFTVTQTPANFPTIVLGAMTGIGGDLTGADYDPDTGNVTLAVNAVLVPAAGPLPTRAQAGGATLYLGLTDVSSTATYDLGDGGGPNDIFKGGAIGNWTNAGDFEATLNDIGTSGIEVMMTGDMTLNSFTTLNTANTVRGSEFLGVGQLTIASPVDTIGGSNLITRTGYFDPVDSSGSDTTGDYIVRLEANSIGAGQTLRVKKGAISLRAPDAIQTPSNGTLEVGEHAQLNLDDGDDGKYPNWGYYNILADGVVRINGDAAMNKGAVFTIDASAYVYLDGNISVNAADPNRKPMVSWGFDNVNLIVSSNAYGDGVYLGEGRMLTTPVRQGQTLDAVSEIKPSLSNPPTQVMFANAVDGDGDLTINSAVSLPGVDIWINDVPGVYYSLPTSDADLSREYTELDGRVYIDQNTLQCDDIELLNGYLRLGNNDNFDMVMTGALNVYTGATLDALQSDRPLLREKLKDGTLVPGGINIDNGTTAYIRYSTLTTDDWFNQQITLTGNGDGYASFRLHEQGADEIVHWNDITFLDGANVWYDLEGQNRDQIFLNLKVQGTARVTRDDFSLESATALGGPATLIAGDLSVAGGDGDITLRMNGPLTADMTIDMERGWLDVLQDPVAGALRAAGDVGGIHLYHGHVQPAPGTMSFTWGENITIEMGGQRQLILDVDESVEADDPLVPGEWLDKAYKNIFAGTVRVIDNNQPGTLPDVPTAANWNTTLDVEFRGDRNLAIGDSDRGWVEFTTVEMEQNAQARFSHDVCRVDLGEVHLLGDTAWISSFDADWNNFYIGDVYGNIATGEETLKILTNRRLHLNGTIQAGAVVENVGYDGRLRLEENFAIDGTLLITDGRAEIMDVDQVEDNILHVPAVPAGSGKLIVQRVGGQTSESGEFRLYYGKGEGDLIGDAGWGAGGYTVEVRYNNMVGLYVDEPDTGENVNKYNGLILVKNDGVPGSDARLRARRGDNRAGTGLVWFTNVQPDLDAEITLESGASPSPRLRVDLDLAGGNAKALITNNIFAEVTATSATPALLTVDKTATGSSHLDLTISDATNALIDNTIGGGTFRVTGLHLNGGTVTVARTGANPVEVWPQANSDPGPGLIDIVGYDTDPDPLIANWTGGGMEWRVGREGGVAIEAPTQIQVTHGMLVRAQASMKFVQAEHTFQADVKVIDDGTDVDAILTARSTDDAATHQGWTPGQVRFDSLTMGAGSKAELTKMDWGGIQSQLYLAAIHLEGNAEIFQNASFSGFFIRDTDGAGTLTVGGSEPTHLVGNIGTGLRFNGWGSIDPTATLGGPVEVDAGGIAVVQQAAAGTTFTVRNGGVLAIYDAAFAGTVATDAGAAVALAADVAWDDDDVNPTGIMVAMEGHSQTITLDNPLTQIGG